MQAKWTDEILDETFRSISRQRPELEADRLLRTRAMMCAAVPDCLVTNYQDLVDALTLPDPDDRHILAAAIRSGAQAIVTFNLRDFPEDALAPYAIEALHPDDFVLDCLDLAPGMVLAALQRQVQALRNPPRTLADLLDTLEGNGLPRSMARVRPLFDRR